MSALLARFATPAALMAAAERFAGAGYERLDAFAPFPLPDLLKRIGPPTARIGWVAAVAALAGGGLTWLTVWWTAVMDYPLNVGGRPLDSWPAFLPVVLVAAALWSGLATLVAMLFWSGLPRWHHPLFDVEGFDRATFDRFFLLVDAADPAFEDGPARQWLAELGAETVEEVVDSSLFETHRDQALDLHVVVAEVGVVQRLAVLQGDELGQFFGVLFQNGFQAEHILHAVHDRGLAPGFIGFFGGRHFSQANEYLKRHGKNPIVW